MLFSIRIQTPAPESKGKQQQFVIVQYSSNNRAACLTLCLCNQAEH